MRTLLIALALLTGCSTPQPAAAPSAPVDPRTDPVIQLTLMRATAECRQMGYPEAHPEHRKCVYLVGDEMLSKRSATSTGTNCVVVYGALTCL